MFKLATSYLGISSFQYYAMTSRELSLMIEGYLDKFKNELELNSIATKIAVINANNNKKYKVFTDKKNKEVDIKEKRETLKELKQLFT